MRAKKPRGKRSNISRYWVLYFTIFFLLIVTTIFYLSTDTIIQQKGREIGALKEEVTSLTAENNKLRLEKAALSTPRRLEEVARKSLGMIVPGGDDPIFYMISHGEENLE